MIQRTFILLVCSLALLAGCGSVTRIETLPGHVGIEIEGAPTVTASNYSAWIWLRRPYGNGSIQTVDNGDWVGVEYHPRWLWRPDWHRLSRTEPVVFHRRVMTIREGGVQGVRIAPWGVALLSGFPPNANRETQFFYGQQGEILSEDWGTATIWFIELHGTETPPRLRIGCADTGHFVDFFGE